MSKNQLTLGSLFDGIGGWLASATDYGIKPLWSSEIARFPLAVTHQRFPDVEQIGDIRNLDGGVIPPVDIICMGSPCQGLSLAGKRGGLEDDRSGLFREATRIIREMRQATDGKYPRFVVWENVPGAFSSNKGMDFRAVLEEIGQTEIPMPPNGKWANAGVAELPECEIAWRVLDAQYWGVPQRRRRVFVVGHSDNRTDLTAKVLFEPESLCGDIAAGKEQEQETSERVGESSESTYFRRGGNYKYHKDTRASTLRNTASPDYFDLVLASGKQFSGDSFVVNGRQNPVVSKNRAVTLDTDGQTNTVCYIEKTNTQCCIRRLTPLECERLQGFPDNYTQIEWRGKPAEQCPDSLRYKAIGNSMAVPVMRWIGESIKRMEK